MALVSPRRCLHLARISARRACFACRDYASVQPLTVVGGPPRPPGSKLPQPILTAPSALDALILAELRRSPATSLPIIVEQYVEQSNTILSHSLPYESTPSQHRRVSFDAAVSDYVAMVAHAAQDGDEHKVALSSGFALNMPGNQGETVIVTCAHTLEEMRNSALLSSLSSNNSAQGRVSASGTLLLTTSINPEIHTPAFHPVQSVLSALHIHDLLLLSVPSEHPCSLRALPVSPYPVNAGTAIRAHFVVDQEPKEEGWRPWVGGTWSKWVPGTVLGYRDLAGREAKPGTYDALSHMLFKPLPTPGSSGGPIVDEQTGAVVGVILGTRMDNRVEGVRGWGVPSELIFEMFSLPGLNLAKK